MISSGRCAEFWRDRWIRRPRDHEHDFPASALDPFGGCYPIRSGVNPAWSSPSLNRFNYGWLIGLTPHRSCGTRDECESGKLNASWRSERQA
jgi:hypothetical protein